MKRFKPGTGHGKIHIYKIHEVRDEICFCSHLKGLLLGQKRLACAMTPMVVHNGLPVHTTKYRSS